MNKKLINYFGKVCIETSKLSTCASKKVGCILIKDKRIIACGYNGVPAGLKHCDEIFSSNKIKNDQFERKAHHEWSPLNELHAEQNMISFCAKEGISTNNTILFVTLSPCINCAKLIFSAGIKKVYYLEEYDLDKTGLAFLDKNHIDLVRLINSE